MVREELGPRGIWGRVHGVGLVQGVTRSGLVCDSPSARSADAREARFLVELNFRKGRFINVQSRPKQVKPCFTKYPNRHQFLLFVSKSGFYCIFCSERTPL